jgi:hypothetical protein
LTTITSGSSPRAFGRDLFDLAAADQRGGNGPRERHDPLRDDLEPDGGREPDAFRKARFRIAIENGRPRRGASARHE